MLVCAPQTPSASAESTSDPEAIAPPAPSERPPPTPSYNSYYNAAPCLPPYTAYDLQVWHLLIHKIQIWIFFFLQSTLFFLFLFLCSPQGSYLFPDSSGLSDDSQSGASHLWPTMVPPRYSPPHDHPDEKPPPYSPWNQIWTGSSLLHFKLLGSPPLWPQPRPNRTARIRLSHRLRV